MITGYPSIVIPQRVSHMVRVFENNEPPKDNPVPVYWDCFFVYFKATRCYYAGITCRFKDYLNAINSPGSVKYNALPKALLKQLRNSTDFQFIVTSRSMRNDVEHAFRQIGVLRVATKMGEGDNGPKSMFRVYNPVNKVMRYVITDTDAEHSNIITSANIAFAGWLNSPSQAHHHLRITLRTATNSLERAGTRLFKENAVVERIRDMNDVPLNKHRQIIIQENLNAAKQFLMATTGAR